MESRTNSRGIPFGAAKLCEDIASLVNNRQGSDVQFKVGGGFSIQDDGEIIYDESTTVTLYAHSPILRCRSPYFVTLLDEDKDWKEESKCVIRKPNISPSTLHDILRYIYTGDVRTKSSENIIELITVANEMGLEELSAKCQSEFVCAMKYIFSDKDGELTEQRISIDVAVRTHVIPALNLANSHSLSHLSHELLSIMLPHMSIIIKSPDAYTTFVNGISSEVLFKIIASDYLALKEHNVWDLALSWGCHQTKLSKSAVEGYLSGPNDGGDDEGDDEESRDGIVINDIQFELLKDVLTPFLSSIRFSLLSLEDYRSIAKFLAYMLPRRRYLKINEYFLSSGSRKLLDAPRLFFISKIIVESTIWKQLRKRIFKTGGITGCRSSDDLKFELLFRASDDGFLASTFHERCNHKGPSLVIIRSDSGHLFGGVNFNDWTNSGEFSPSTSNFLFALTDGHHRKDLTIFKIKTNKNYNLHASLNRLERGPIFGGGNSPSDLLIANSANTNMDSFSNMPNCYNGSGASKITLAGSRNFMVSDYEVFAISIDSGLFPPNTLENQTRKVEAVPKRPAATVVFL